MLSVDVTEFYLKHSSISMPLYDSIVKAMLVKHGILSYKKLLKYEIKLDWNFSHFKDV